LSPAQISALKEPELPAPQVYIMLPPLKLLKTVVEKMKHMAKNVEITANMKGELTLKVETDMVCVSTFYRGLTHPEIGTKKHVDQNFRNFFCRNFKTFR
jgi:HUS1 checkpoint protein